MNLQVSPNLLSLYIPSSDYLLSNLIEIPKSAVIAGSGIANSLDESKIIQKIQYNNVPGVPRPTVLGHSGDFILYNHDNKISLIFSGRFHYYEGRSIDEICSLVTITKLLGIDNLVITNAAGGVNPMLIPGDLMIIEDYIDLMFLGTQSSFTVNKSLVDHYPNSSTNNSFKNRVKSKLIESGLPFKSGVYAAVTGPNYETRAEVRMLRKLGADAVGMSTVPEAKLAEVLGINLVMASLVTNSAKEVLQPVSHDEVIDVANRSAANIRKFIEIASSI